MRELTRNKKVRQLHYLGLGLANDIDFIEHCKRNGILSFGGQSLEQIEEEWQEVSAAVDKTKKALASLQ